MAHDRRIRAEELAEKHQRLQREYIRRAEKAGTRPQREQLLMLADGHGLSVEHHRRSAEHQAGAIERLEGDRFEF
jgi:hypothetical protein